MARRQWTKALAQRRRTGLARAAARRPPSNRRQIDTAALLAELAAARAGDARVPARQAIDICPVPKPRMSSSDRWNTRACVERYRAACDELRLRQVVLPHRYVLIFTLPLPGGWSTQMQDALDGLPHLRRPDTSNLQKWVEDALVPHDEALWSGWSIKVWGRRGRLVVLRAPADPFQEPELARCRAWLQTAQVGVPAAASR